ncbi:MAG: sigma-70 family RNA polymerase sigma factor [Spirochaetaceae bacterium]|nr:sigma-70 family RNA polymerase sigma factor [Spirochaetaceae bacterium]
MSKGFDKLYRTYGPMVIRRCRSILKDEEAALDISQDVFLKVFKRGNLEKLQYPSSFLYTIATNLSLNYLRDNRKGPVALTDKAMQIIQSEDAPEDRVLNRYFTEQIFSKTKASTRTIAYLRYIDGLTLEETAETVGMSVSGIRKRLRGLRELGLQLQGE